MFAAPRLRADSLEWTSVPNQQLVILRLPVVTVLKLVRSMGIAA
jgi:hypothetical protein